MGNDEHKLRKRSNCSNFLRVQNLFVKLSSQDKQC